VISVQREDLFAFVRRQLNPFIYLLLLTPAVNASNTTTANMIVTAVWVYEMSTWISHVEEISRTADVVMQAKAGKGVGNQ